MSTRLELYVNELKSARTKLIEERYKKEHFSFFLPTEKELEYSASILNDIFKL
jgi:hypothetical protein